MPHFKGFAMMNLLLLFLQPHSVTCRALICNCSNRPLLWAQCPSYLFSLALGDNSIQPNFRTS